MKFRNAVLWIPAFAISLGLAPMAMAGSCGSDHSHKHKMEKASQVTDEKMKSMDIVETAIAAGSFETLVAAVKAAGLVETLQGEGPFTVFAPTDEAFGKLPEGTVADLLKPENKSKLQAVLTYHVVPGKVMSPQVVKLEKAKTVQGQEVGIKIKDGRVMIDDATVAKADIEASNGVIHVIDTVILPEM